MTSIWLWAPAIAGAVWNIQIAFSGVSILIVVGVALETMKQLESQLTMRHYEGFTPRAGRIRGGAWCCRFRDRSRG